eukprot:GILK01003555.1.p1 GENE.GILK01003555.1~~GILK01003555.1.p1  ORF type:complete len:192 (+),score=38.86 GILK01003555.1:57-632(+)
MEALKARIRRDGKAISDSILKVDSFLNHQVDPELVMEIGRAFADEFRSQNVTKVLTIEASGIHFAFATALQLGVPFVYAKKKKAVTQAEDLFVATVFSFTRQESVQIAVSKKFITAEDRVLIIDDFLATGNALTALKNVCDQAGCTIVGSGLVVEKSFQNGRQVLEELGLKVFSLVRIASLSPTNGVQFVE